MGIDYALVHIKYTIPPGILLGLCYYPLATRLGIYKIVFLVAIAVLATTPWDSYLIRRRIWTYPSNVIIGPTLFHIPAEEVFFFIIQTLNTSLLYLLLSKPIFHPIYLKGQRALANANRMIYVRWIGIGFITAFILAGAFMVAQGGTGHYLGLILVWAGPFVLLLWTLAYQFIQALPFSNTLLPILLPTVYLWAVDTIALRRGTWVIESGTKLGLHLWPGLEIEEACFFLLTNILIVFGLVAFDNAFAILQAFPAIYPKLPALPSPLLLVHALLLPVQAYDEDRIRGLQQALSRLRKKSRSFYLASGTFQGRLRTDLILLYSFCRVADDLVDEAGSAGEAQRWIMLLRQFLDLSYQEKSAKHTTCVSHFVLQSFPDSAQQALILLPTHFLSSQPLYDLLAGFETDLQFSSGMSLPIANEGDLRLYGARVAGTVAELCIELIRHHTDVSLSAPQWQSIISAGGEMGVALQYINIARDITVDAANGRLYLPSSWIIAQDEKPEQILHKPYGAVTERLRQRLLDRAFLIYESSRGAIAQLPPDARAPMRVAVESYMEIGRVLRTKGYRVKAGRATVPKTRRICVALKALREA